jgi:hypothetical protein
MYPTSADQGWPNSGKPEFGCKRGRGRTESTALKCVAIHDS